MENIEHQIRMPHLRLQTTEHSEHSFNSIQFDCDDMIYLFRYATTEQNHNIK